MDPQMMFFASIGASFTVGGAVVALTVHATTTRKMAESASHKAANAQQAHAGFVAHADAVFARKDVIAEKFHHIQESLDRIEANQVRGGGMGV
jgi:hypothetical protein